MTQQFSEITFEELPEQRVVCCRIISQEPENDSITTVQNWLVQHGYDPENRRSFGFDSMVSPAEAVAGFRGYEVGFTVDEGVKADDGVQLRMYGGGMYGTMRIYNAFDQPFESIPAGWKYLMEGLESNREWKPIYHLCYEEVVKGDQGNDMIIYHPVVSR